MTELVPQAPAPNKSCGDCGLCCKLLGIEAINKQPGSWCGHFKRGGGGCGIYADRPAACAGFHCLWLTSDKLGDEWKPNKAGFVMYPEQDGRRLNIVVDQAKPMAWKEAPYHARIKAMSQRAHDGYELLISIGRQRIVVFPDQDIDLGQVDPDHKILSGYTPQPDGGKVPFAMVLSDAPQDDA